MQQQSRRSAILRLVRRVAIAELVIILIVGALYWFLSASDWSWKSFANALFLAGGAVIGIGFFLIFGGWGSTRNFRYQHSESAGSQDIHGRTAQASRDLWQNYSTVLEVLILGAVTIATSMIIEALVF